MLISLVFIFIDLLLDKKPQKDHLLALFIESAAEYKVIGTLLGVDVGDLFPDPKLTNSNLIDVFQRWIASDRDVSWGKILQVCDHVSGLGKAKADVNKFLSSDEAHKTYL